MRAFAQAIRQQVVFSEKSVEGRRSQAVSGKVSADAGLDRLLSGTGISYRRTAGGVYHVGSAQSAQADGDTTPAGVDQETADDFELVVTGSRIRRSDTTTSAPVRSFGSQDLSERGYTQVGDMLNDLTSNAPSFPTAPFQGFPGGPGKTSPNLFNLGAGRTLTLVNGRRMVASASGLGDRAVDTNIIPSGLVKRIEVVQAGGASVYGSDAIAGVVNYILKDDFEGVEIDLQNTISSRGDDWRPYARLTAGTNFGDGRGNIALNVEYAKTQPLYESDRPLTALGLRNVPNPANTSITDGIPPTMWVFGGHMWAANTTGVLFGSRVNLPSSLLRDGAGQAFQFSADGRSVIPYDTGVIQGTSSTAIGGEGRDYRTLSTLATGVERYSANLLGHYDLTDNVRLVGEFLYGEQTGTDPYGTQGLVRLISGGATFPVITFNRNNPFLTQDAIDRLDALSPNFAAGGDLYLSRFLDILPTRNRHHKTKTWRAMVGLEGTFEAGDRNFNWSLSASRGKTKGETSFLAAYNAHFDNALNSVRVGSEILCAINADAITTNDDPACVPLNPFGSTTADPRATDYISILSGSNFDNVQDSILAIFGGDLLKLPGGTVGFSLAYEHRRETVDFVPFEADQLGLPLNSTPAIPVSRGYNTDEFSGELVVPLIGEDMKVPLVRSLEVSGSGRYVDHSIAGKETVWGAGVRWDTGFGLVLRGSRSRNFRAPTLEQQFAPTSVSFLPLGTDPCDADRINAGPAPATRLANCQALFAANPGYGPLATFQNPAENTGLMAVTIGGNPNLKNEISNTLTYGFTFQPRFIPGLSITVDRVEVDLKDGLSSFTPADFMAVCYDTTPQPADFCSTFTRNADGYTVTGRQTTFNAGSIRYRGEVYNLNYILPLEGLFNSSRAGTLEFGVEATHTSLLETSVTGFDRTRSDGTAAMPDWRGRLDVRYSNGPFRMFYQLYYLPSVKSSFTDTIETVPVPVLSSNMRHTISFQYELDRYTIRAGVNNFTDRGPSFPNRGYGDIFGRQFFVGVKVKL